MERAGVERCAPELSGARLVVKGSITRIYIGVNGYFCSIKRIRSALIPGSFCSPHPNPFPCQMEHILLRVAIYSAPLRAYSASLRMCLFAVVPLQGEGRVLWLLDYSQKIGLDG